MHIIFPAKQEKNMYLSQKQTQFFPFSDSNPNPRAPKPFDEALIRRLSSLPKSSPSVPLSFLISAVNLLSSTLTSFSSLLSDPNLSSRSEPDIAALSSHLDFSTSLLDAVNALSYAVDRLSLQRLHLSFALHLVSHRPDLMCKARASLAEWGKDLNFSHPALAHRSDPPRVKISAVQRAIYAVEAISALVIASVFSFLGAEAADLGKVRVSEDFAWSEAYNGVVTVIKGRRGGLAAEIEAVDSTVKELTAAVDGDVAGLGLRFALEEAERRTEELTVGLDRLGGAVNGLFRAALNARNAALLRFRICPKKCK